jgi:protein-disulfide isomerase
MKDRREPSSAPGTRVTPPRQVPVARRAALLGIMGAVGLQIEAASALTTQSRTESPGPTRDEREAISALVTADLLHDAASPVLGNPAGDATVVEFFDYRCPYCKVMAPRITALIAKDAGLRLVMKEYPILGRESFFAAKIALVAARHGPYVAMHAGLFALNGPFNEQNVMQVAQAAGLSPAAARAEMDGAEIVADIRRNMALGEIIGVNGTPAFLIDGSIVPGAVSADVLEKLIMAMRKSQNG